MRVGEVAGRSRNPGWTATASRPLPAPAPRASTNLARPTLPPRRLRCRPASWALWRSGWALPPDRLCAAGQLAARSGASAGRSRRFGGALGRVGWTVETFGWTVGRLAWIVPPICRGVQPMRPTVQPMSPGVQSMARWRPAEARDRPAHHPEASSRGSRGVRSMLPGVQVLGDGRSGWLRRRHGLRRWCRAIGTARSVAVIDHATWARQRTRGAGIARARGTGFDNAVPL